ncbi:MAG: hypothetical protein U0326_21080 [Polyangiales bacterium]
MTTLHDYVAHFDPRADRFPSGLPREEVERFVVEQLRAADLAPMPATRLAELTAFYHLDAAVDAWRPRMRPEGRDANALAVAAQAVRAVALVGDTRAREEASAAFAPIAQHPRWNDRFAELLPVAWALGDASTLSARLDGFVREQVSSRDPQAGLLAREAADVRDVALPRLTEALAAWRSITAQPSEEARLDRCADVYVGRDMTWREHLEPACVWLLARVGFSDPSRPMAAFRRCLARMGDDAPAGQRAKALAAVQVFGGDLSAEEVTELRAAGSLRAVLAPEASP